MGMIGTLVPLVILFSFVGVFAWVGYQMYVYTGELADRGVKHLEKKNIQYTKEGGLKVGVKEVKDEDYTDKTQNVLVKAWNLASFPGYKSKIWNSEATPNFERTTSSSNLGVASGSKTGSSRSSSRVSARS